MARPPLVFSSFIEIVEPRGLGDHRELAPQREWIERAHILVEFHAHASAGSLHSDLNVGEDDGVLQRGQSIGEALVQRVGPVAPSIHAVPRSTLAPSRLHIRMSVSRAPLAGLDMIALTSSPSKTGLR